MRRADRTLTTAAALFLCGGCADEPVAASASASSGVGGAGGSQAASSGPASAGGGGAGGDLQPIGPAPSALVDRGVLVRYFIREAAQGQGPTELEDAATEPLPLALSYGVELAFTEVDLHRGLAWSAIETDWRAARALDGSKVSTALQGATAATIELVVAISEVSTMSSRLFHIGSGIEPGRLTLSSSSLTRVNLLVDGYTQLGTWEVDYQQLGRVVLHAVYDSDDADESRRARVYVNGSQRASLGGTPAELGHPLDFGTGSSLVLGNREIGARSAVGVTYYAALYSVALSDAELLDNAIVLSNNDDDPGR